MAKQRMVNTRFWSDNWVSNLDPVEKLLFLYLLTNERTNLCGIYELPIKYMAIETGIEKEMVEKVLVRFNKDKKVFYFDGWIYLKNAQKYQNLKNESIKQGIDREISELPAEIKEKIKKLDEKGTSGIPEGDKSGDTKLNLTKLNLTKPNLTYSGEAAGEETNQIIKLFELLNPSYERLYPNKTQRAAVQRMVKKFGIEDLTAKIKALPKIVSMPYAPRITTPLELETQMGKIQQFLIQEKGKVVKNKNKVGIIQ